MPVAKLLCEGGRKQDTRVISKILDRVACQVTSGCGKNEVKWHVRIHRESGLNVAGLRDRDFDSDLKEPSGKLREWSIDKGKIWLGWCWERLELENYLIDPQIVKKALGLQAPDDNTYRNALESAAVSIAEYTAARYALSGFQFPPMNNKWGQDRGESHCFPDQRSESDCREMIEKITHQSPVVDPALKFDDVLVTCRPGGIRFKHYLVFFSGKDLLHAMRDALVSMGFQTPWVFRDRIVGGLEKSSQVWEWAPEWTELETQVRTR